MGLAVRGLTVRAPVVGELTVKGPVVGGPVVGGPLIKGRNVVVSVADQPLQKKLSLRSDSRKSFRKIFSCRDPDFYHLTCNRRFPENFLFRNFWIVFGRTGKCIGGTFRVFGSPIRPSGWLLRSGIVISFGRNHFCEGNLVGDRSAAFCR